VKAVEGLESIGGDVRHAGRLLRQNLVFTATVALTLAFGIGANTALFSICNAILLKPLPYPDPDRIVMLWEQIQGTVMPVAPANFVDWREQSRSFSEVAAINPFPNFVLSGQGEPVRLTGAAVSWNFLSLLGAHVSMGRSFLRDEDQPGRNRVAILSHGAWIDRLGGQDIIGKILTFNDVNYTVVGVLPQDFEFVGRASDFQARNQFDVWIPLGLNAKPSRGTHPLRVFARLKPGATLEQAQADLNVVAANLASAFPEDDKDRGIRAVPLFQQVAGDLRPALLTLLGAVGFVLLVACANVANLLLCRGAARHKEMSVRLALGASRVQIAQQLLIESALVALLGGSIGLVLALTAVRLAVPYLPADLSRAAGVEIDARVMLFAAAVSLGTGILFGLAPLIQARRVKADESLTHGTRVVGGVHNRLRNSLVIGQIAVTLLLLIGAGLMTKSLWTLLHVPTGLRIDDVLTARLTLSRSRYPDPARIATLQNDLLERLQTLPGVQSAGFAAYLPLSGDDNGWAFTIEGRPPLPAGVYDIAKYRPVSHAYFETIGMPLIRGRDFTAADGLNTPFVVVINESMARAFWGRQNPVGQRLRFGNDIWRTVIGVAGDVRHEGLDRELKPEMYVPFAQAPQPETVFALVVRTSIDAVSMTPTVRKAVSEIDASLPMDQVRTMEQLVSTSVAQPRFRAVLLGAFSILGLMMASIGIYGVVNYSVTQRTREFGIYLAVGATPGRVLRVVLGEATILIVAGLGVGLIAAFVLTRYITNFLYGVTPLDPMTFVIIPAFLFVVAFVACCIPARRATRTDPMVALRYE
jgi:predicted permease